MFMKVLRVQNAYHIARDMSRLRAFYETALGVPLKFADGDRWIQFGLQGTNFSLSSPAEAAHDAPGAVVVFEVDSLDNAESVLAAQGGRVMERRDMGAHGHVLTFADPEGNVAQLFCRGLASAQEKATGAN
jgi:predicted enzyme related to lactoylglutathione lyase